MPDDIITDGQARRIAAEYGKDTPIAGPLARLYWTGQVLPGDAERIYREVVAAGKNSRDQHGALVDAHAMRDYCQAHEKRGAVDGWGHIQYDATVVPWSYPRTTLGA